MNHACDPARVLRAYERVGESGPPTDPRLVPGVRSALDTLAEVRKVQAQGREALAGLRVDSELGPLEAFHTNRRQ